MELLTWWRHVERLSGVLYEIDDPEDFTRLDEKRDIALEMSRVPTAWRRFSS